jgi:hypothetical protein
MKTITLQLTDAELQVIAAALGNVPYRQAAPVLQSLGRQVEAQQQAANAPELPLPKTNGHAEQPSAH